MLQTRKNSQVAPKGVRLKWAPLSETKSVTVKSLNIKGKKVFADTKSGSRITCNSNRNNLLIP